MKRLISVCIAIGLQFLCSNAQQIQYPQTAKVNQVDNYFGISIADPYRWLEDDTTQVVDAWITEQNKITFGYLDKIPFRQQVKDRLIKIWNYPKYNAPFRAGKNWFFFKNDGLQNQNVLYIQKTPESKPSVFLDPNGFSSDGTIALNNFAFSNDGRYFAYAISRSGSDWQEISIMEVSSKKKLTEVLKWAKFTGIAWLGNGFFYNRYTRPVDSAKAYSDRNEYQKVCYHVVGTKQEQDRVIYEDKDHPLRMFGVGTTDDERFVTLSISQKGSKGNALYYRDVRKKTEFKPIIETFDDDVYVLDNFGDKLLLVSNRHAPNSKVVLFDPAYPGENNWKDILPEKPDVLANVTTVGKKIVATYLKDVSHRVYVYNLDGAHENEIQLPVLGTVSGFWGRKEDTYTFFSVSSFTTPATIYKYDISTKISTLFRKTEIEFNPDLYEIRQVFYHSTDSTRIPMFIVHKKEIALDGNNPTLLYGYGGFNASMNPTFSTSRLIWLEQGGVYALANIRGGGEYGEKWHEAGMQLKKQNVFDDFIAAAEYLIKEKYTSPSKLAIQGGSNGGLLVGAVTNQRPELYRVALPAVGVMDMLRFHKFTIGWAWIPDYGSSEDSVQFLALVKYSPLHNIRSGVNYPSILATTADHDDRVVPAHSFKYIAKLQEAYKGPHPILVRIETKAGHGGGKPTAKIINEISDIYSFVFNEMGIVPKY